MEPLQKKDKKRQRWRRPYRPAMRVALGLLMHLAHQIKADTVSSYCDDPSIILTAEE